MVYLWLLVNDSDNWTGFIESRAEQLMNFGEENHNFLEISEKSFCSFFDTLYYVCRNISDLFYWFEKLT